MFLSFLFTCATTQVRTVVIISPAPFFSFLPPRRKLHTRTALEKTGRSKVKNLFSAELREVMFVYYRAFAVRFFQMCKEMLCLFYFFHGQLQAIWLMPLLPCLFLQESFKPGDRGKSWVVQSTKTDREKGKKIRPLNKSDFWRECILSVDGSIPTPPKNRCSSLYSIPADCPA